MLQVFTAGYDHRGPHVETHWAGYVDRHHLKILAAKQAAVFDMFAQEEERVDGRRTNGKPGVGKRFKCSVKPVRFWCNQGSTCSVSVKPI